MGFWHILAVFRKGVVFLSFYHPLPSFILQYWPPRWCALERLRPAICQAAGVGKGPSDALGSSDAASNGWTFETAPCSHGRWIQELQCALCRAIQSACWSLILAGNLRHLRQSSAWSQLQAIDSGPAVRSISVARSVWSCWTTGHCTSEFHRTYCNMQWLNDT